RLFVKEQYDIVHTHSSKAGIIGRLAATSAGVPVVVHTIHGQAFHPYESWWRNRIYIAAERFAARRCDRIFAVAAAMVSQCVDSNVDGYEKYRTIYSGMELEPFANTVPDPELARRLGLRPGSIVVGKIARLFELKGYDFLLQAAPKIIAAAPDMQFLIVGDGDLRPALEAEVGRLGMTEHFVFAGLVAPAEIPQYTALMDLLVHLSLREGLPRSVVQAQAAGKPVVGFDLDGTPEIIQDGKTGFLCPAENVDAVADGVVRLLKDADLRQRLGAAGQERARQWDWRAMVDAIETEYTQLLAAKQSSPTP
ncbi:MAG TPA: glycosyltransferase family 1 protein, partial [Lentisphaeria bacterium]|nr:glycosyltransferase family 1 protein [Lentisphaeria bacterium]